MAGLTDKQAQFVREYLIDLNATQAAIRAGYAQSGASVEGHRLLRDAKIIDALQAAIKARSERTDITADYVLSGIREVAERCLERAPVMEGRGEDRKQATDDEGNHIWQFDAAGANRAFELLGKHLKLFTEKHEHTGKDGGPIQHEQVQSDADAFESSIAGLVARGGAATVAGNTQH